jgi:crossover junction endodeoxyribonuclease RuvC
MITIGIDPGLTGAIAVVAHGIAQVVDMPIVEPTKAGGKKRAEIDPAILLDRLRSLSKAHQSHAYIERVGPMPKQGLGSTFRFGVGYGMVRAVVAALGIPYSLVTPHQWKRAMGLLRADKEASRAKALQLYPSLAKDLKLKKHSGRAEALLIARYGAEEWREKGNGV